jgi:acyl carrier protein
MSEQELLASVAAFLHERTGVGLDELTLDTDLVGSRLLDSFGVIELFFHMESLLGRPLDVTGFTLESVGTPRAIHRRYCSQAKEG